MEGNSKQQEINSIKSEFTGRCRVTDGVKDKFTHSITIQPQNMDVTIKFQITETYPGFIPTISVRSSSLHDDDNADLVDALIIEAKTMLNKPMIKALVQFAEKWLNERSLGRGTKMKKPTSNRKHKQKKKPVDEEPEGKQASMKTSEDVIKRIQWDPDLPQEDFLVGYIDRFLGIQEKYFTAFSWEDIATVDYNVLAIPQHRIQYFKYKDLKVWDKNEKLDNVFGSLGSGKTITEIIKNYVPQETAEGTNDDNGSIQNVTGSDDSDSDDDIVVTLDTTSVNTSSYLDHMNKRPTHFIAIRLDNQETVQKLTDVQSCVKTNKPELESGFMPPACFHITLCTLGLDDQNKIREASELLKKCQDEFSKMRPVESLKLTGVDNFYNRTVYAKIKYPKKFLDFVDYVKLCFVNAGIPIRDNYGFVPHITILKVSKESSRRLGSRFQISDVYSDFKDGVLGSQSVDRLSLCKMGDERQDDGFWVSLQDIDLNT
ncbi:hypothetical protein LOTGIDRAFT_237039 [Lottia gigantea]|uniref:RWD domain-containing protein n=1 Tax=Lottia gigantea TaxID=225164 RepID=V3YWA4_LOTGI|nr:hypothetical protein LOTGIDRAFT_237039 [Lottia gigantea]ESO82308.1 hypothetical protein LOTGIDRAFT_237039 [Lottia gigantea]